MTAMHAVGAPATLAAVLIIGPASAANSTKARQPRSHAAARTLLKRLNGVVRRVPPTATPDLAIETRRSRSSDVTQAIRRIGAPLSTAGHAGAQRPVRPVLR